MPAHLLTDKKIVLYAKMNKFITCAKAEKM